MKDTFILKLTSSTTIKATSGSQRGTKGIFTLSLFAVLQLGEEETLVRVFVLFLLNEKAPSGVALVGPVGVVVPVDPAVRAIAAGDR